MVRFRRGGRTERMYSVVKFLIAVPCVLGIFVFAFLQFSRSKSSVFHGIESAVNLKPGPHVHHTRKVIFMGPPGVGKSTYGRLLASKWQTPFITMSSLLREETGKYAPTIKKHISQGTLVPNEIVWEVLQKRLLKKDAKNGFFLDGFPRSSKQVEQLDAHVTVDAVLELNLPDAALETILLGRRICSCPKDINVDCATKNECGSSFNVATIDPAIGLHFPPLKPKNWESGKNTCGCGGTLQPRSDDTKEIIESRIAAYRATSPPIINHYKAKGIYTRFDVKNGLNDINAIEKSIMATLLQLNLGGRGKPYGRQLLDDNNFVEPDNANMNEKKNYHSENSLQHQHTL